MVRLRAIDFARFLSRPQYRLLDAQPARLRVWEHWYRHQYPYNNRVHALSRDDPRKNAAARLAQPCHVGNGATGRQSTNGRANDADDRPLSRWTFFRYSGGRVRGDLDALLLDLWPS